MDWKMEYRPMRVDVFLPEDVIAPFEDRKIEDTEEEKEKIRQEMRRCLSEPIKFLED